MSKKIIKKGTVQETLLIPLYGRKLAMDMYPGNFHDMDCQKIFEQVEMIHEKKGKLQTFPITFSVKEQSFGII